MFTLFYLFIVQVSSSTNTTKLRLEDSVLTGTFPSLEKCKVVFSSKNIFTLTLYTSKGEKLYYKSSNVTYIGNPTFYKLKSLGIYPTKVMLDVYTIERDVNKTCFMYLVYLSAYLSLVYKRDSSITRTLYFVLVTYQLLNTSDHQLITTRIIQKYIF